jgi:hypothetical protein
MEIWHRIGYNRNGRETLDISLRGLGVEFKQPTLPGAEEIAVFNISESDSRWDQVSLLIRHLDLFHAVETTFTNEEIRQAEWVRVIPTFEYGYPQPKSWSNQQPNLTNTCPHCHAGFIQIAPYRLSGEPRIGKRHFFSLYWTYTLFARQEVITAIVEQNAKGYQIWEAILDRIKLPSKTVAQIYPVVVAEAGLLDTNALHSDRCLECGIVTYQYHNRGYMHFQRGAIPDGADFVRTREWFGEGRHKFQEILVSNRLAQLILDKGWIGVRLKPLLLI